MGQPGIRRMSRSPTASSDPRGSCHRPARRHPLPSQPDRAARLVPVVPAPPLAVVGARAAVARGPRGTLAPSSHWTIHPTGRRRPGRHRPGSFRSLRNSRARWRAWAVPARRRVGRLPPIVFFIQQPIDAVTHPATHRIQAGCSIETIHTPSSGARPGHAIDELAARVQPSIQASIEGIRTALGTWST